MATHLYRNMAVQAAVGAVVVVSTTFLVRFASPLIAALVWAYPISLVLALIFLTRDRVTIQDQGKFVLGTIPGLVALLAFQLTFISTAENLEDGAKPGDYTVTMKCIAAASLAWAACACVIYMVDPTRWFT